MPAARLAAFITTISLSVTAVAETDETYLRLQELDDQIAAITEREGIFSTDLFDPLMEAGRLRLERGLYDEAEDNLHQAQNISHRAEGVYSLKQLAAVNLLAKISILEEEYGLANRQKKFAHFVATHALDPDDPAYLNAYVDLARWYLATDQARRARDLLGEAAGLAEENGMDPLPWQIMILSLIHI